MKNITVLNVELPGGGYPIYIGPGILGATDYFQRHIASQQVVIVSNETIAPLYLQKVVDNLIDRQVETIILPDGELYKNLDTLSSIFDYLLEKKFNRNATLIALGGGVIGDIGGFAAACYQRGIPFIQIPTTLLAQVDSSVGGKTGVNHPLGKNMIGAFYQPKCVIADTTVLRTLDDKELSAGIAEIIKYGLIRDKAFFEWLEHNMEALLARDPKALSFAIQRSCQSKADVVAEDEMESDVRATLNLGHTFGHAIESGSGYGVYLHGEAVAIGMCQAADLSRRTGRIKEQDVRRIIELLKRAELPVRPPENLDSDRMIELMSVDKKNVDGAIRVIMLDSIGQATLPIKIAIPILKQTLEEYGRN